MSDKKNSGPEEGIKGVVEDVKGKAKEAVGTVAGRDDLVREGKAQPIVWPLESKTGDLIYPYGEARKK